MLVFLFFTNSAFKINDIARKRLTGVDNNTAHYNIPHQHLTPSEKNSSRVKRLTTVIFYPRNKHNFC